MNLLRKYLGIVWMLMGVLVLYYGITVFGYPKLISGDQEDLVFGLIICFVLLPIIVGGLVIFGWYAWQGEYDEIEQG